MNFNRTDQFEKELRNLSRKKQFRNLEQDLENLCEMIEELPVPEGESKNYQVLRRIGNPQIVKRRMGSRQAPGRHLFRVVYAYYSDRDEIEFMEIFSKNDKANEDKQRVKDYRAKHGDELARRSDASDQY